MHFSLDFKMKKSKKNKEKEQKNPYNTFDERFNIISLVFFAISSLNLYICSKNLIL